MTDDRTPTGDLRERLAEALTREHYRRARERIKASPEEHCAGFADAVLPVIETAFTKQTERAEEAEATVQRVRDLAEAALPAWQEEHEHHRERAERKGYSHDEAAAEAYGRAIEAVTEILAALEPAKENP